MTELGQVEIKRRLLSGVVDCELLSDTYDLISALQAEILELKVAVIVKDERIVKRPAKFSDRSYTIKPSMYKTKSECDND